jgi:hypothetical protein
VQFKYTPQRRLVNFICRLVCSLLRIFVARWNCADVSEESLVYIIRVLIKRTAGFSVTSNSLHGIASDKAIVLIIIAVQTTNLEFVSYRCCVSTPQHEGSEIYFQDSLSRIDFPHSEASHTTRFSSWGTLFPGPCGRPVSAAKLPSAQLFLWLVTECAVCTAKHNVVSWEVCPSKLYRENYCYAVCCKTVNTVRVYSAWIQCVCVYNSKTLRFNSRFWVQCP